MKIIGVAKFQYAKFQYAIYKFGDLRIAKSYCYDYYARDWIKKNTCYRIYIK